GKAADYFGFVNELFISLPSSSYSVLANIANSLWNFDSSYSSKLLVGKLFLLFKSGDKSNPGNYRPITILSCFYKFVEIMIWKRIKKWSESKLSCFQGGFRIKRSCPQQALTLTLLQQI